MDHFEEVYSSQAGAYHQLIGAEDVEGHLLPAIQQIAPLSDKRVLDLGTGTGRMPLLCRGLGARFMALDRQQAMLAEHQRRRDECDGSWPLIRGDLSALPFHDGSFDVIMAGWAVGHTTEWHPDSWRARVDLALSEMQRVAHSTGVLLILETMGTGASEPGPPSSALADYYTRLEQRWGFARTIVQTDYLFSSVADASRQMTFFFGPGMGELVRRKNWKRVPEWTGLWSKHIS